MSKKKNLPGLTWENKLWVDVNQYGQEEKLYVYDIHRRITEKGENISLVSFKDGKYIRVPIKNITVRDGDETLVRINHATNTLRVTEETVIETPYGTVKAKDLKRGSEVNSRFTGLNSIQRQYLLGKLLVEESLKKKKNSCFLELNSLVRNEEYLEGEKNFFATTLDFYKSPVRKVLKEVGLDGKPIEVLKWKSYLNDSLTEFYNFTHAQGYSRKVHLSEAYLKEMSEISLAAWYDEGGGVEYNSEIFRITLKTKPTNLLEKERIRLLFKRYGIEFLKIEDDKVTLTNLEAWKFMRLISPFNLHEGRPNGLVEVFKDKGLYEKILGSVEVDTYLIDSSRFTKIYELDLGGEVFFSNGIALRG